MDLSRIILGPIVTEKAERLKSKEARTYTLWVDRKATKIDVRSALHHFYDVEVASLRSMTQVGKRREIAGGKEMQKRPMIKKVLVTLTEKSKPLDLALFKH